MDVKPIASKRPKPSATRPPVLAQFRSIPLHIPGNDAALQFHIANIVAPIAKAAGAAFLLPNAAERVQAYLTVVGCGQNAGFGEEWGAGCMGW